MTTGLVADVARMEVCLCIIQLIGKRAFSSELKKSGELSYRPSSFVDPVTGSKGGT